MGINIAGVSNIKNLYPAAAAKGAYKAEPAGEPNGGVSLSQKAKDYQAVKNSLAEVPDVRADVVDDIINRIKSGKYNVGSDDVADKMIRTAFGI